MKYFTLFCFVTCLSLQCHAQQRQSSDKLFYVKKVEKYRRMKNTGTFLTLTGGVLFIVTIVNVANSIKAYNNGTPQQQANSSPNGDNSGATFLGGVVGLGAGIPLWIVGAHSQRKYDNKLQNLYVGFNINQKQTGFTLKYRF